MIKVYCDRCKKQIKSGTNGYFGNRFNDLPGVTPEINSYRGEVSQVMSYKSKFAKDEENKPITDFYYLGKTLCANCQKELDLMVNEYMGVKRL